MRLEAKLRFGLRMTRHELIKNLVEEFIRTFRFGGDLLLVDRKGDLRKQCASEEREEKRHPFLHDQQSTEVHVFGIFALRK